jgi:hypothetical protein
VLRFFAPRARGRDRLIPDLADWRGFAGRVASALATPLPTILAMRWDEMMRWVPTAIEIAAEGRIGMR